MEYAEKFNLVYLVPALLAWLLSFFSVGTKVQLWQSSAKKVHFPRLLALCLGIVAWVFFSISIQRPRTVTSFKAENKKVNDLFLLVDVSRSMLAEDFKINRLESAKAKIKEFVKLRPKERTGLILFSEKVMTLVPLTHDSTLLAKHTEYINSSYLGSGTNIGDAIALATERLLKTETKSKAIILMTDGVSNVGQFEPLVAAQIAKDNNIRVYTIGIGRDQDAKIPLNPNSVFKRYQSIPGGSFDSLTLKEISDTTGGKFYKASDKEGLGNILTEISKLEKSEIKAPENKIFNEKYLHFLILGALFFLASEVLRRQVIKEVA